MSLIRPTFCFAVLLSYIVSSSYAFRSEYTFVVETNSFYKYHPEGANWSDADAMCKKEGATLFYPENESEITQVFSELKVEDNGSHMWIGINDFFSFRYYETVDGRPISQVYNKWLPGEPRPAGDDYRCISVYENTHGLYVYGCSYSARYICKRKIPTMEGAETTMIEEVKTLFANASDKQTTYMERLTEAMQQQTIVQAAASENQTNAFERLTEAIQRQSTIQAATSENQKVAFERLTEAMQRQSTILAATSENQTIAFERLTEAMQRQSVNLAAVLERQADAIERIALTLERQEEAKHSQAANQTAVMKRLALALEKLAEDNQQLDVRSQQ